MRRLHHSTRLAPGQPRMISNGGIQLMTKVIDQEIKPEKGLFPIVLGITGHRDLRDEDKLSSSR